MTDFVDEVKNQLPMGETEANVRLGIGAAAAAAAIFAPLDYTWKGVLTAAAAITLLSGIYGFSPTKRLLHI